MPSELTDLGRYSKRSRMAKPNDAPPTNDILRKRFAHRPCCGNLNLPTNIRNNPSAISNKSAPLQSPELPRQKLSFPWANSDSISETAQCGSKAFLKHQFSNCLPLLLIQEQPNQTGHWLLRK